MKTTLRKAIPDDSGLLTRLAYRSKQSWGYPEEWLKLWEEDLIVTPDQIRSNPTFIILYDKHPAGFCQLEINGNTLEIMHMWIHPEFMSLGLGRTLLNHSLEQCHSSYIEELIVISDPNAVGFYRKFGFQTIEWVDSRPEGRKLPIMKMSASATRNNHKQVD